MSTWTVSGATLTTPLELYILPESFSLPFPLFSVHSGAILPYLRMKDSLMYFSGSKSCPTALWMSSYLFLSSVSSRAACCPSQTTSSSPSTTTLSPFQAESENSLFSSCLSVASSHSAVRSASSTARLMIGIIWFQTSCPERPSLDCPVRRSLTLDLLVQGGFGGIWSTDSLWDDSEYSDSDSV